MMEIQQSWRARLSFKNATILVTVLNVIAALLLLQGFLSSASSRSRLSSIYQSNSVQLRYIKESEEIRLAMQPWELIKRVKEIEQEVHAEPEADPQKNIKQTAAVGLSNRLKDLRTMNDAASSKALDGWRKRKMERARQRQLEKNGTASSRA